MGNSTENRKLMVIQITDGVAEVKIANKKISDISRLSLLGESFRVLLCQLSYAINNQLKAPKVQQKISKIAFLSRVNVFD